MIAQNESLVDLGLALRAKDGDHEAFEELYRRHEGLIGYFAKRWAEPDSFIYSDLVSAGMQGLMNAVQRFKPNRRYDKFSMWAGLQIRFSISNFMQKKSVRARGKMLELDDQTLDGDGLANHELVEAPDARKAQKLEDFERIMEVLNDDELTVVELRYFGGRKCDYKKLARMLGVSVEAVRMIELRALRKIKKAMANG